MAHLLVNYQPGANAIQLRTAVTLRCEGARLKKALDTLAVPHHPRILTHLIKFKKMKWSKTCVSDNWRDEGGTNGPTKINIFFELLLPPTP